MCGNSIPRVLKPNEVHPTHNVEDHGRYVSDPMCTKCRIGVYDTDFEGLLTPCNPPEPFLRLLEGKEVNMSKYPLWVREKAAELVRAELIESGYHSVPCTPDDFGHYPMSRTMCKLIQEHYPAPEDPDIQLAREWSASNYQGEYAERIREGQCDGSSYTTSSTIAFLKYYKEKKGIE